MTNPRAPQVVRYADLRPCTNAFIDSRTPGSETKENFTIIGPGVSENPDQYVHIAEPHGFNIGGARQPPGCVNSQHSHDTAEVFVVHSGRWRFDLGEHGDDARVECGPGDTISLPTRTFRGFTNIGDDTGFLWAVLGGDDPGRVTWAPQVFELARDYGLVLLETGRLVDTAKGEAVPDNAVPMSPTTPEQVAALTRYTSLQAELLVARKRPGGGETPVIAADGPLNRPHGFTVHRLDLDGSGEAATVVGVEVIFVHRGSLAICWDGGQIDMSEGDTATVPHGLSRTLAGQATAFIVRGPGSKT